MGWPENPTVAGICGLYGLDKWAPGRVVALAQERRRDEYLVDLGHRLAHDAQHAGEGYDGPRWCAIRALRELREERDRLRALCDEAR